MRIAGFCAVAALLLTGVSAPAPAEAQGLQISKCQTRALIGAAAGALIGNAIAGKGDKTKGAVVGGAVGAGAGFGVCKWMDSRSQAKAQASYDYAAKNNKAYSTSWQAEDGTQRSMTVNKPVKTSNNCRQMNSSMTVSGQGKQAMPAQTYCQGADGVWRPA